MIQFDTLIPGIRRTSLLTLLSLGLILIGTFAATILISSNSQSRSKAVERNMQTLASSCNYSPPTNGDDRSGAGCQLTTKPEVSYLCASCITANQSGFREWWDSTGNAACNNIQIVSNWRQMEPDGKRNFYHGHTTEPGGPCNCSCANELANPGVDYGSSPSPTTYTPAPPTPTTVYLPTPTTPPVIPHPSPTPHKIFIPTNPPTTPSPTTILLPTNPPIIIEATPTRAVIYPTLNIENTKPPVSPSSPPAPAPGIHLSETIAKEIKKIQSTLVYTSKKGVELGQVTTEKGKNWLWQIFSNFLSETSF